MPPFGRGKLSLTRDHALLAASGAALMLTQYVAVREIGSTFFSTELVTLIAVATTLIGPSLAYATAHRLRPTALAVWGALSVLVHVSLPFGLRALVGTLAGHGFEAEALGATAFLGVFFLCGFYAVFLPSRIKAPLALPAYYAAELLGALVGLLVLILSPSWRASLAVYFAVAVLVVHLGVARPALTGALAVVAATAIALYPRLDAWAARVYLAGYWGLDDPKTVHTVYSPYQRIDVVDEHGDPRQRSLFLDGVPFYRAGDLDAFNTFLARVPGSLGARRGAALVVGSGSLSSAAHLSRLGYDVTVVELDGAVLQTGLDYFADVHELKDGDIRAVVADGRRFVAEHTDARYAIVVLDVPAPYHVQTALLHTPSFYTAVKERLAPGGVVAISLSDSFSGDVGRAVAASAASVFPDILVIEAEDVGLAELYAGAPLPFSLAALARFIDDNDLGDATVWADADARAALQGVAPLSADHLASVLVMARDALPAWTRAPDGGPR